MADDRMKNDDSQRNMSGAGREEGQDFNKQSPGRSGEGQQAGGQQKSNYGSGQNERDLEDDDVGAGNAQTGGEGHGGQNR